jgi:hypothetical protein
MGPDWLQTAVTTALCLPCGQFASSLHTGNIIETLQSTTYSKLILSWQQRIVAGPCTELASSASLPRWHDARKKNFKTRTQLSYVHCSMARSKMIHQLWWWKSNRCQVVGTDCSVCVAKEVSASGSTPACCNVASFYFVKLTCGNDSGV